MQYFQLLQIVYTLRRYPITVSNQKWQEAISGLYGGWGKVLIPCVPMYIPSQRPGTSARTVIVVMFHVLWQIFCGITWSSNTNTFWYRYLCDMSFCIINSANIILLPVRLQRATCGLKTVFHRSMLYFQRIVQRSRVCSGIAHQLISGVPIWRKHFGVLVVALIL